MKKNLIKNKAGEKIDTEMRTELNIDFLKEELVEATQNEKNPLAVVFNLDQKIEEIKTGLAKTEHLMDSKEIINVIAAAAPGKIQSLEKTLFSDPDVVQNENQDTALLTTLSQDDPLRKDFYQRLSGDFEMQESSESLAKHFKTKFINEISNYTAQIGIAQGFHDSGFLRDLLMAALIYLRTNKDSELNESALPKFTKELLKRADTFEDMDSTYVDSLQVISLVKEIVSNDGFAAGTAKIDQKLLTPALHNAMGKEELFSLTFLERTKQFVDRGIKLHDSSLSFQLSRDAILGLRKLCS